MKTREAVFARMSGKEAGQMKYGQERRNMHYLSYKQCHAILNWKEPGHVSVANSFIRAGFDTLSAQINV